MSSLMHGTTCVVAQVGCGLSMSRSKAQMAERIRTVPPLKRVTVFPVDELVYIRGFSLFPQASVNLVHPGYSSYSNP